jgi:hypothetical protein
LWFAKKRKSGTKLSFVALAEMLDLSLFESFQFEEFDEVV